MDTIGLPRQRTIEQGGKLLPEFYQIGNKGSKYKAREAVSFKL